VTIYLVRHAKAGSRRAWKGDDYLRPLPPSGRRQAKGIADLLEGAGIERIVSSQYVRCRQTVDPLAYRLRLPVELSDALVEGAPVTETMRLIEKVASEVTVLCTHGDVVENVLEHLRNAGVAVDDDLLEKGSVWVFETHDAAIVGGHYVPPPA
jgi:phosphohistidine phosphatase SixA